jgi:hypothetical protein
MLKTKRGWEIALEVQNEITCATMLTLINYDYLRIKYRFYLDPLHQIKDCPSLPNVKGKDRKINLGGGEQSSIGDKVNKVNEGGGKPIDEISKNNVCDEIKG